MTAPAPDHHELVLSEEELDVHVVRRAREVVRIRKRIVTEEQTITVTTRREELVVERRPATAADQIGEHEPSSSFDRLFTLSAEEVAVQTRTVPQERVRVWVSPRWSSGWSAPTWDTRTSRPRSR